MEIAEVLTTLYLVGAVAVTAACFRYFVLTEPGAEGDAAFIAISSILVGLLWPAIVPVAALCCAFDWGSKGLARWLRRRHGLGPSKLPEPDNPKTWGY